MNDRAASRWLMAVMIVVTGLGAYANSFHGPFILDDIGNIAENPTIRHLSTALFPPSTSLVGGRPVLNLSLAINYAVGGLQVEGYHVFNLTIHLLAGLTLYGIIRRTLLRPVFRDSFAESANWIAGAVGMLWTVHPLQTEAVTYISQRCESLMGLFYLLTLYLFIRGTESAKPAVWFNLSIVTCFLGVATKEVMLTAPLIVFLYDRTFISRTFREAWNRHRYVYLGLASSWLLLGLLMQGLRDRGVGYELGSTWWGYALVECQAVVHYLYLAFWPHPLILDYGKYEAMKDPLLILPYAVLLASLIVVTFDGLKRRPVIGFIGAWFFVILAPTSSVLPVAGSPIAEHRMYLPLAVVVTLVIIGVWRMAGGRKVGKQVMAVGVTVVVLTFGWLTGQRNKVYASGVSIWSDVVAHRPHNTRALVNLGAVLIKGGLTNEAIAKYEEAIRLDPNNSDAQFNLGLTLAGVGDFRGAEVHLQEAVRIVPHSGMAQYNLGILLAERGDLADAQSHLTEAVRFAPHNAEARNSLGSVLARQDHLAEAEQEFNQALLLRPDYAEAHVNLGMALAHLGRLEEAVRQWETALRLDPRQETARRALATIAAAKSDSQPGTGTSRPEKTLQ